MSKKQILQNMQSLIDSYIDSMTLIGGAGVHIPFLALSWITMTIDLAEKAGHSLDYQSAKKLTLISVIYQPKTGFTYALNHNS